MTKKVYHLKHATPRMKYQHMLDMMEFRADLKDKQVETMTEGTRQWMIEEIKRLSPSTFHAWYDKVYPLRRDGKPAEYETAIRHKYDDLQSELETAEIIEWLSPSPADYDLPAPVIISGGEVLELSKVSNPDENIPF